MQSVCNAPDTLLMQETDKVTSSLGKAKRTQKGSKEVKNVTKGSEYETWALKESKKI